MQSTVGPVKSVQMSYNAQGKTTGSATVLFRNKGDAHKAHASCEWVVPRWREEREQDGIASLSRERSGRG